MNTENLEKLIQLVTLYIENHSQPVEEQSAPSHEYVDFLTENLTEIVHNFDDPDTQHLIHQMPDHLLSSILGYSLLSANHSVSWKEYTTEPFDILMRVATSENIEHFLTTTYTVMGSRMKNFFLESLSARTDHWHDVPLEWLKEMYPVTEPPHLTPADKREIQWIKERADRRKQKLAQQH